MFNKKEKRQEVIPVNEFVNRCPTCGHFVDTAFCPYCGTPLKYAGEE